MYLYGYSFSHDHQSYLAVLFEHASQWGEIKMKCFWTKVDCVLVYIDLWKVEPLYQYIYEC